MGEPTMIAPQSDWRAFVRRHRGAVLVFGAGIVLAVGWAVYVFWWFTGMAQSTDLVPSILAQWTMGHLVSFIINAAFWELILVGIPVIVGAVGAWQWLKRLPMDERLGRRWGKRGRSAGGGVSFLFFVAFAIKVYLDGNWNLPFAMFSLNYVVGSMITILLFFSAIFGIPASLFAIWWIRREMRRQ